MAIFHLHGDTITAIIAATITAATITIATAATITAATSAAASRWVSALPLRLAVQRTCCLFSPPFRYRCLSSADLHIAWRHLTYLSACIKPCCIAAAALPVTSGLTGYYTGDSYLPSTQLWQDLSGANNHAQGAGNVRLKPDCIYGKSCVYGQVGDSMQWPQVRFLPLQTILGQSMLAILKRSIPC